MNISILGLKNKYLFEWNTFGAPSTWKKLYFSTRWGSVEGRRKGIFPVPTDGRSLLAVSLSGIFLSLPLFPRRGQRRQLIARKQRVKVWSITPDGSDRVISDFRSRVCLWHFSGSLLINLTVVESYFNSNLSAEKKVLVSNVGLPCSGQFLTKIHVLTNKCPKYGHILTKTNSWPSCDQVGTKFWPHIQFLASQSPSHDQLLSTLLSQSPF